LNSCVKLDSPEAASDIPGAENPFPPAAGAEAAGGLELSACGEDTFAGSGAPFTKSLVNSPCSCRPGGTGRGAGRADPAGFEAAGAASLALSACSRKNRVNSPVAPATGSGGGVVAGPFVRAEDGAGAVLANSGSTLEFVGFSGGFWSNTRRNMAVAPNGSDCSASGSPGFGSLVICSCSFSSGLDRKRRLHALLFGSKARFRPSGLVTLLSPQIANSSPHSNPVG
jgi:hypothetical protein